MAQKIYGFRTKYKNGGNETSRYTIRSIRESEMKKKAKEKGVESCTPFEEIG